MESSAQFHGRSGAGDSMTTTAEAGNSPLFHRELWRLLQRVMRASGFISERLVEKRFTVQVHSTIHYSQEAVMSKHSSIGEGAGEEQLMLDVLRAQMDCDGVSAKLKSQIRISILKMLGHSIAQSEATGDDARPALPRDLAVVNSLIKEYLEWVGYTYSSMIISSESSSNSCPPELSRSELQSILNLEAMGTQNPNLPLLYILVEELKNSNPRN